MVSSHHRASRRFSTLMLCSAIAVGLVASTGCSLIGGSKDKKPKLHGEITFGVIAPLSGSSAARGQDVADGAAMAAAELNERGGVLGRRVVLKAVDDSCTPAGAKDAVTDLVGESVVAAVGGVCDDATATAVATIRDTRVPFLITSANGEDLTPPESPAFLLNGTPYMQALSAVHWMAYNSAQRVALLEDDSPESQLLTKHTVYAMDVAPEVASRQTIPSDAKDMAQYAKIALASEPDFVYWTGSAAGGGALIKALRDAGYTGTFAASAQSESPEFLETAGEAAAEGAFVVATAGPHNIPAAKEWAERFSHQFNRTPGFDALQGYDALRAVAQAVEQAKDTGGDGIITQLQRLDDAFSTFLGPLRFAPDHTMTYDNRLILVAKNGAFTLERTLRTDS